MKLGSLCTTVLIATLAISLTGCSRNPVAPTTVTQLAPGAGAAAISPLPDDPPPVDGGTPISRVVSLTAQDDGVVVVGRFTLRLRKNTLKMPATITLTMADPEAMECRIEVSPPQANAFQQPAVLTANLSDVAGVDYSRETMFRWSNGGWQQASDVSAHPNQQNVVAHFTSLSDCMVGPGSGKKGKH